MKTAYVTKNRKITRSPQVKLKYTGKNQSDIKDFLFSLEDRINQKIRIMTFKNGIIIFCYGNNRIEIIPGDCITVRKNSCIPKVVH